MDDREGIRWYQTQAVFSLILGIMEIRNLSFFNRLAGVGDAALNARMTVVESTADIVIEMNRQAHENIDESPRR